jgi:hypothetical protein
MVADLMNSLGCRRIADPVYMFQRAGRSPRRAIVGGRLTLMSIGDTLFQMTEWLRTTWVVDFSLWLSETAPCLWLQEKFVAIPSFQSIHILAIGILFGSTLMVNLRILGFAGGGHSVEAMFRRFMPWVWGGLATLIVTGIILLVSEPVRNMVNPIFWIKMGTLLVTLLVTIWFQSAVSKRLVGWDRSASGQGVVRTAAWALIVLWCLVMAGGRWIAYAPV